MTGKFAVKVTDPSTIEESDYRQVDGVRYISDRNGSLSTTPVWVDWATANKWYREFEAENDLEIVEEP